MIIYNLDRRRYYRYERVDCYPDVWVVGCSLPLTETSLLSSLHSVVSNQETFCVPYVKFYNEFNYISIVFITMLCMASQVV